MSRALNIKIIYNGLIWFLSSMLFLYFTTSSHSQEINSIQVVLNGDNLFVSASFNPGERFLEEAKNGIKKELRIYIDLFRVWRYWPDEFVYGVEIINRITGDAVKGEFIATSLNRQKRVLVEKRFRTFGSMLSWLTTINSLNLINTKSLEEGDYYVKITVESVIKQLPPVIGYLLFFVPEKEFSIDMDSETFRIGKKDE